VVEVLLEVRHYLSDIHQVHLHFTHINIRQIVGHVVHTLLCTIVKVLNFLEALKLTWVATDKFKVLHFFFCCLEGVFHFIEFCSFSLKSVPCSDLSGNLSIHVVILTDFLYII